jgi:hypothetical protein
MPTGIVFFTVQESFLSRTLTKTKHAAKTTRNLHFNLSLSEVMAQLKKQNNKCALTGWDLEFTRGGDFKSGMNPMGCTIDRIDNDLGYTPSNIQLVCCKANIIRGRMSITEFKELCSAVAVNAT